MCVVLESSWGYSAPLCTLQAAVWGIPAPVTHTLVCMCVQMFVGMQGAPCPRRQSCQCWHAAPLFAELCRAPHSRSTSPRAHGCYVSLIPGDPLCHSYCTTTASSNCTMVEQDLEVVLWRGCENSTMWQDWGPAHAPCAASLCLSVCKCHVDTLWITFVDSITQDIWLCSEL